jgi:hypothetical protein
LFVLLASKLRSWKQALVQGARMAPCNLTHCCVGTAICFAGYGSAGRNPNGRVAEPLS